MRVKPSYWAALALVLVSAVACTSGAGQSPAASAGQSPAASAPSASSGNEPSGSAPSQGALPDSPRIKKIQEAGVLRAGTAIALPWLGQDPASGEYIGPGVTIAELAADALGVEVEWVPQEFAVMAPAIQADKVDLAVAGLYETPARLEVVNMTDWDEGGYCWLVKKDNDKINTTADLNSPDVTMSQQEGGGTYQVTAEAYPLAKQLVRLPLPGENYNLTELLTDKADAVPIDSPLVLAYLKKYPELKAVNEDCGDKPDLPTPVSVAYAKDDPGFQEFIETLIADNKEQLEEELKKFKDPVYYEDGL